MLALIGTLAGVLAVSGGRDTTPRLAARDSAPTSTVSAIGPRAAEPVLLASSDTGGSHRPRAVEYSEWYHRRLEIHRIASYTELPLFAAEYVLGDRLIRQQEGAARGTDYVRSSTRNYHSLTAGAIAGLFGINTVTGLWNLYDARNDTSPHGLRTAHTILMLAADAGFAATGLVAGNAARNESNGSSPGAGARTHRNVALASMGVATVGTAIMWFRHD